MVCFFAVLFVGVEIGIAIAIGYSLLVLIFPIAFPSKKKYFSIYYFFILNYLQ
jgi:MFS superfamily sulfate permease-like transporter